MKVRRINSLQQMETTLSILQVTSCMFSSRLKDRQRGSWKTGPDEERLSRLSLQKASCLTALVATIALIGACDGASGPRDADLNRRLFEEACVPEDRVFRLDEVFNDPDWDAICWVVEYSSVSSSIHTAKKLPEAPQGDYTYIPNDYFQTDEDRIISLVDFESKTVRSYVVGPKAHYSIAGLELCYSREFAMAKCQPPDSYFDGKPTRYVRMFDSRKSMPEQLE